MSRPAVVLDACVLVPIRLATTLLWLAESGLFQPLWSPAILDEVQRALPKVGISPQQAQHRIDRMRQAFDSEASIDDFEHLIDHMRCDPKDRHVLAAAVHARADTLVTFNLRDFPAEATTEHGINVAHPDDFLLQLVTAHPDTVRTTLEHQTAAFRHPPQTITQFLDSLAPTVPTFAQTASNHCTDPI